MTTADRTEPRAVGDRKEAAGQTRPPSTSHDETRKNAAMRPNLRSLPGLTAQKDIPYLSNGWPKTCWGCGNPFIVRDGRADVILAPDNRLYCYGTTCADGAFASHVIARGRAA
jgi:hypothetical protein